jgi:hypothetical protein
MKPEEDILSSISEAILKLRNSRSFRINKNNGRVEHQNIRSNPIVTYTLNIILTQTSRTQTNSHQNTERVIAIHLQTSNKNTMI